MDVSTQLVRAYLHVNGYFTTTEYPLVESRRAHPPRMRTDIDLMAVRFPRRARFRTRCSALRSGSWRSCRRDRHDRC